MPVEIPRTRLMKVAAPETINDRPVMPRTSASRLIKREKAFWMPSRIKSMR
jgi:hypothetical protein